MQYIMNCNICIEEYTNVVRMKITCEFCEFDSCIKCCKKYILDSVNEPHCMSCKRQWNRKILFKLFDKTFINTTLKKRREEILLEKERGMLPATQPFVELEIAKEKLDREISEINKKIFDLREELRVLMTTKRNLTNHNPESEKKIFVRACSNNECKGFLSSNWSCPLCEKKTCRECHEIEEDDHKCDASSVATAKLLAKDTRNCPSCGTQIFKIEGCDQMFCTQCHTPFSWNTGKIEKGVIHNPHYFEWIRNNTTLGLERNIQDIPCGREIDEFNIIRIVGNKRLSQNRKITIMLRNLVHMRQVVLPKFQTDALRNNQDMRIKFMRNVITEEQFKRNIQKRDKDVSKKTEIRGILQTFILCSTDLFYRLTDNNITNIEEKNILNEIYGLIDYTNTCLSEISEIYNCKTYWIDSTLTVY